MFTFKLFYNNPIIRTFLELFLHLSLKLKRSGRVCRHLISPTGMFSQQTFWIVIEGKAQVLQITLTMALVYSESWWVVAVCQWTSMQTQQEPETVTHFIIYTCAFPSVTCQRVLHENGSLGSELLLLLCFQKKGPTWPSVCGAPACAVGPPLRWHAGPAAASLAQSAACAGRHQSGEIWNNYKQLVKTQTYFCLDRFGMSPVTFLCCVVMKCFHVIKSQKWRNYCAYRADCLVKSRIISVFAGLTDGSPGKILYCCGYTAFVT